MIIQFPEWSDVGKVSPQMRNAWMEEMFIRNEYRSYFDGSVFENETVPADGASTEAEKIELYPIGLNLVKMLCTAQADSEMGEWDQDVLTFEPDTDETASSSEIEAAKLAKQILRNSKANTLLWENSLERNIYGGSPIQIIPDLKLPSHIRWAKVPLDSFFPIWDPEDIDELLEVYIITAMTLDQAKAKYGYDGGHDIVYRVDHWTRRFYESMLDGKRLSAYSGQNPWGFVPFEYIPRMRTTHWWGDCLTQDLKRVQNELNMRIADLGEAINYNAHPIKWGLNLKKAFRSDNFPVSADTLWDLGQTIGSSPKPEVGILEAKNPLPQGTFDFIKFLYDWGRTSVASPPIAFGEDNGGGQRSGITLEIRMWPLIKAVRRSRSYQGDGVVRALKKSGLMLKQKKLGSVRAVDHLVNGDLVPNYAPIMPRDQAAIVDEVTKRFTTNPPSISLETATKKLGSGAGEVQKIKDMLNDDTLYKRSMQSQLNQNKGMDSGAGNPSKETV